MDAGLGRFAVHPVLMDMYEFLLYALSPIKQLGCTGKGKRDYSLRTF